MPNKCFVPACKTGYNSDIVKRKKDGMKSPSLFKAPKDPFTFEKWQKSIPRADRTLRPGDTVCELHFKPEDIDMYYETKLFNGNIHRIYRSRHYLKPGVVPCIFPNVPGHSTFVKNKPTEVKKKCVKRKKISNSSSQNKSKKAKISCPDNKPNKMNSSHQKEKENVLMEVIVVHPILEKASTTQSSFLKGKQKTGKTASTSLSEPEKHVISEPELQTTPYLSPTPEAITESHFKQNFCNKILTESSSPDNLANNYFTPLAESVVAPTKMIEKHVIPEPELQTSPCLSPAPDAITENHYKKNFCNKILTVSSSLNNLTNNYFTPLTESVVVPTKTYSKRNNITRTKTESSNNYSNQRVCDIISTESLAYDASPGEDSDLINDDEVLNEFSSAKLTENNVDDDSSDKMQTEHISISVAPIHEDFVNFEFLKANVSMFETENSWWRVNTFDDFIVFSRWTSDYTVERRIVITKDLTFKVFLHDKETTLGRDLNKFTIDDIAKLIYRVENLKICSGIDKKDRNCAGFLQGVFMCYRYNLCLNCIKWKKKEKKNAKRLKESENRIELLNFKLVT